MPDEGVTSTQLCKAMGVPFRVVADVNGVTSYLLDAAGYADWEDLAGVEDDPLTIGRSTFVLDSNGLIERVPPEDSVLFINLAGGSSPTQLVFTADQATVEDGAPDFVRIKGLY